MTAGNQLTKGVAQVGDLQFVGGAKATKTAKVTMTAATGAGAALSWVNPEGATIIVTGVAIHITTESGAATTIDVGTTAVSGTTSSDNLIDGASTAATAPVTLASPVGTNGRGAQHLEAGDWVTGSITGTIGSFAGTAYISYVLA